jgi:hypothetical protein
MANDSMNYFGKMTELLVTKRALLAEMLELTREQTPAIEEGSLDKLQKLIEEKQKRIDGIDRLDAEFTAHMEKLKATAGVKDLSELDAARFPGARELKHATAEIMSIVEEISSVEKINSAKSKELLEKLGAQVRRLNQAKKLSNAYNKPDAAGAPSFFMDKKK